MDNKVCSSCQKPTKRSLAFSVEGEDSTLNFPVGESDPSEPVVPCISTCATVPVTEPDISNSVTVSEKVQERHIKDHSSRKIREKVGGGIIVSVARESAGDIKLGEHFEGLCGELLEINNSLLMALLEDSQGDSLEYDRLDDMIQSLEAEIYQSTTGGHGLGTHIIGNSDEDGENHAANISGRFGCYDWSDSS
ncbi:hypothetical protein SAY87_021941 [Trapa incisa]|uniref:Uncharacterized protein n=1 Tax=Trapa incisa TaxID=236973 RepID=A0AAN7JXU4_9MYRT|nr:hypothetical protein SAY87_021941 [Trapa incisa]